MKLEDHLAPFFLGGSPTIEQIANEHPDLIAELKRLEPIKTATTFAGLLTLPKLQANCLRIEVLVHLAAAYCEGRSAPTKGLTKRSFERLGDGYCGRMEDPAEDVFLTLVNTPRGNFRIFEGIREGTGFYLQRILNVVEVCHTVQHTTEFAARLIVCLNFQMQSRLGLACPRTAWAASYLITLCQLTSQNDSHPPAV